MKGLGGQIALASTNFVGAKHPKLASLFAAIRAVVQEGAR